MWIIFRDPETVFLDMDKYIVDVLADDDILAYQTHLLKAYGGQGHEVQTYVYFMQPFMTTKQGVHYFARKYKTWGAHASM
jgi:hypothetical protein